MQHKRVVRANDETVDDSGQAGIAWLGTLAVVSAAIVFFGGYWFMTSTDPGTAVVGGNRPTSLLIPGSYDLDGTAPLLVVLHPYGGDGSGMLRYAGFERLVADEGVLVVAPDGTEDQDGKQFWNASSSCCNLHGSDVDDVAYLAALIGEITDFYRVDPDRVYIYGHSNGAFMAHRLACERADLVAGIVATAGASPTSADECLATDAVSVLAIHGDADRVVGYQGGDRVMGVAGGESYPGAKETVRLWAHRNECDSALIETGRVDLAERPEGTETVIQQHGACPAGVSVELWTMKGASHVPSFHDDFPLWMWDWYSAHPKV